MNAKFWENALAFLGLAVLVVAGGWVIRQARREMMQDRPERLRDALAPFDEAFRRGQMSEAEHQRIQRSLERRQGRGDAVPPKTGPRPDPNPEPEASPAPEATAEEPGAA